MGKTMALVMAVKAGPTLNHTMQTQTIVHRALSRVPKLCRHQEGKPPVPRLSAKARSARFSSADSRNKGKKSNMASPTEDKAKKGAKKSSASEEKGSATASSANALNSDANATNEKARETARRRAAAKVYIHKKKQQRYQDKLRARMAREMADQKRLASLRALDTQSRKAIKARQRAALAAAPQSKSLIKPRKNRKRSGGATAAASSRRRLRERQAAKRRQKQNQNDVYEWQPIVPSRRGNSGMFDVQDLNIPELPSPQRRLGLSSEEEASPGGVTDEENDEIEDCQGEDESGFLNRQAFLQDIEVSEDREENEQKYPSHDNDSHDYENAGAQVMSEEMQTNYSFEYEEKSDIQPSTEAAMEEEERVRLMALREEANELRKRISLMKSTSAADVPPAPNRDTTQTSALPVPAVNHSECANNKRDEHKPAKDVADKESSEETGQEENISAVGIGISSISTKAAELQVPPTPKRLVTALADYPEQTPKAISSRPKEAPSSSTKVMPPFLSAKSSKSSEREHQRKGTAGGVKAALANLEKQEEMFQATIASIASQRRSDEEAFVNERANPVSGVLGMEEAEAINYPQVDLELAAEAAAAVAAATRASQDALKQGHAIAAQVDAYRRVASSSSFLNAGEHEAVSVGTPQTRKVPISPVSLTTSELPPSLSVMDVFARHLNEESVKESSRSAITRRPNTSADVHPQSSATVPRMGVTVADANTSMGGMIPENTTNASEVRTKMKWDSLLVIPPEEDSANVLQDVVVASKSYSVVPKGPGASVRVSATAEEEECFANENTSISAPKSSAEDLPKDTDDTNPPIPPPSISGAKRLSPASLAQRLLAEVDRLDALQASEQQLSEIAHMRAMHDAELIMAKKAEAWAHQQQQMMFMSDQVLKEQASLAEMERVAAAARFEMQSAHQKEINAMEEHLRVMHKRQMESKLREQGAQTEEESDKNVTTHGTVHKISEAGVDAKKSHVSTDLSTSLGEYSTDFEDLDATGVGPQI